MTLPIIKRMDTFILSKFLQIFVGAFFVCLFVFMMQFTWRYVDELIGKGLSVDILAQFFWYMGITLVPTSLPLAILLASLITFGNMGESLELLSMKAAGMPLVRIMRPLLFVVVVLTGVSFYFQNYTSPQAQINLRTLLFSMKQAQPAVEIPEGIFYSGVPNVNLYVQQKDAETGMLYQVIIYKTDQGFDRAQIVLADSARLEVTADKMHLRLSMWSGEQFENLQSQNFSALSSASVPYDRETFIYKDLLIDFDSNFNLMDKEMLSGMAEAKNLTQIEECIDSVNHRLDSIGRVYYAETYRNYNRAAVLPKADSVAFVKGLARRTVSFDSLLAAVPAERRLTATQTAATQVRMMLSEYQWKSDMMTDSERYIRRHWVEWHRKMTTSLACLFFFFVGAPLGAIIRKGGLGMPTVISVGIFILYYIINTSGVKMAREGSWNMAFGMWISSAVLLPCGAFLTYKANNDSVVFNLEVYINMVRRLLGLRQKRHIYRKEVIVYEPHYADDLQEVAQLREECRAYNAAHRLIKAPSYVAAFFRSCPDHRMENLAERVEKLVDDLSNTRDKYILQELNSFPFIYAHAHTSPFEREWMNKVAGMVLPVGIVLWLRIWRFRLRLLRDLRQIVKICDNLEPLIAKHVNPDEPDGHPA